MYELADWGRPAPPDWMQRRERFEARLPADLIRQLGARARAEGMGMTEYLEHVLTHLLHPEGMATAMIGEE